MNHSFDSRIKRPKHDIFKKEDISDLNIEDRQFAQQQFQKIYSEQMSKVITQLSHRKKIKTNLHTIDVRQAQYTKQQHDRLIHKLEQSHRHRQENIQKKVKGYKLNDERWQKKMEEIQSKFKNKNRQALEKANLYRQQSQKYWKDKKNKHDISRASLNDSTSSKNSIKIFKNKLPEKAHLPDLYQTLNKKQSKTHYVFPKPTDKSNIDVIIQKHQNRVQALQNQKQSQNFQRTLQKLDKIEATRLKRKNHIKQGKKCDPTVPKKTNGQYNGKTVHQKTKSIAYQSQHQIYKSKDSLDDLLRFHLQLKQKKDREEFYQRGLLLENSLQRQKRNKIIKLIKGKIHNIKINTIRQANQK